MTIPIDINRNDESQIRLRIIRYNAFRGTCTEIVVNTFIINVGVIVYSVFDIVDDTCLLYVGSVCKVSATAIIWRFNGKDQSPYL